MSDSIKPYETLGNLHQAIADAFCESVQACLSSREIFTVSLSGGSTPRDCTKCCPSAICLGTVSTGFGETKEMCRPKATTVTTGWFAARCWITLRCRRPISMRFDVNTADPAQAANAYESSLRDFFAGQPFPLWDLVLLGMGDDAHTASLFPETAAINQTDRWFVENWVEKFDAYRYTLTAPAINSGREIWFLVAGQAKRTALTQVLSAERQPQLYPAQLIKPTRWFVTADAWVN